MLLQRAPALSGRANAVKASSPATPRHLLHHLPFTPRTSPPTTQGATELKCRRDVRQASWLDSVQEAVTIGAVTGSLVGIAYSAVVTSAASRHTPPHSGSAAAGSSDGGEDNFVWGLMGFISCLPLFNWLVSSSVCTWACVHTCAHVRARVHLHALYCVHDPAHAARAPTSRERMSACSDGLR